MFDIFQGKEGNRVNKKLIASFGSGVTGFVLGNRGPSVPGFPGSIRELRIWAQACNSVQIFELMHQYPFLVVAFFHTQHKKQEVESKRIWVPVRVLSAK